MFSLLSTATMLGAFTALLAIVFQAYLASNELVKLTVVLQHLRDLEVEFPVNGPRVAIGYGSCSDLHVRAVDFLQYNDNIRTELNATEYTFDDIANEEEFLLNFAYYFQRGAAAERFTANREMFLELVQRAKKSPSVQHHWALGGNAPVIGTRMAIEGANVILGAKMSSKLKTHLKEEVHLTGSLIEDDDIHLILEYNTGDTWGDLVSPRANRYILHNDHHNPFLSSLEEFDEPLRNFQPDLFIVSGLQMMDNYVYPPGVREARLEKVRQQMQAQSRHPQTLIHFEMASFVELELLQLLRHKVLPYADSIGMNEQELDNLQQVLETGKISLVADCNPRVAHSLDQARAVFRKLNAEFYQHSTADSTRRPLSRIHLHTLAYQAFIVAKDSRWQNTKNAAAKASLTAHRHVCATNIVNPDAAYLQMDDSFAVSAKAGADRVHFNNRDPVSCWEESILIDGTRSVAVEICVAPVLICKHAIQTVGAGDNISGAGLVLQI
ncbi:ADP-dependent glucokinase [Anopheles ziemanni]|uniref:ADP-dependent glucokinase n=1 Tax=Anopheles coustani TaxID=139045 RepID=UPI00265B5E2C|nr:ADP-dependent glucokinase [Anopheles coustani]XP_058177842.1 ADP-dependent glucokinase [Anopheles ziemanni]